MINIAALVSGRGSNLQAIIDACRTGEIDGRIVVVISSRPGTPALDRARAAGIEAICLSKEHEILATLDYRKIDLVILAGYMKLISPAFVSRYRHRIMNIHPALLPAFPGLHAQKQAWEYGAKVSGCTVHFVDEGMDTGPVILQSPVPVLETDTPEALASRILEEEHKAYPRAIQLFAQGKLKINGRKVIGADS